MPISPDTQKLLAYAVDFSGDEIYSLYVKDLESGEIVDHDPSSNTKSSVVKYKVFSKVNQPYIPYFW